MSNFFRNKVGADKVISVYWFAVIVIIAGGVIAMASNFYGAPYDVRGVESEILSEKVSDCISFQGKLNEGLFNESSKDNFTEDFQKNFFEICGLNFDVGGRSGEYFTQVVFYDLSEAEVFEMEKGNINLFPSCFIEASSDEDYETFPKCNEKRFYSVSPFDSEKQYLVRVISGVRKNEDNVKV